MSTRENKTFGSKPLLDEILMECKVGGLCTNDNKPKGTTVDKAILHKALSASIEKDFELSRIEWSALSALISGEGEVLQNKNLTSSGLHSARLLLCSFLSAETEECLEQLYYAHKVGYREVKKRHPNYSSVISKYFVNLLILLTATSHEDHLEVIRHEAKKAKSEADTDTKELDRLLSMISFYKGETIASRGVGGIGGVNLKKASDIIGGGGGNRGFDISRGITGGNSDSN